MERDNSEFKEFLDFVKSFSLEQSRYIAYDFLVSHREEAIKTSNTPVKTKRDVISGLISFFEEREEYEKCSFLKQMDNEIKELENVST
jgi:hypothetical protein